ncbi:MAG: FG-GAP repeat protein [Chitinophagaceae bacterium]
MPLRMSKIVLAILFALVFNSLAAQVSVGATNTPPDPSAMLDVQSASKGLLFPRMTSLQRRAVINPVGGLVVYDTDKQTLYLYNGITWKALTLSDLSTTTTVNGNDASDGASGDNFGRNVKISGKYAVATSYLDDINGNVDQGSAYVFKYENGAWTQMQKLVADDGAAGDYFGAGVAIDSNYIIIGATYDDLGENVNQGSAYVFKLENGVWVQKQKVTGSNAISGDNFGWNIDMKKGLAVITSALDDIGTAIDAGSAYIFRLNDTTGLWIETQKIYPNDGTSGDNFGNTVCISGDKMIITAIFDDVNGIARRGSAYIFTNQSGNWVQTAKLIASDGAYEDYFGTNAAIQGDFALVGAYAADGTFGNQGACYLFKLEGGVWLQKQKVFAGDPVGSGFFGNSVSLKDNYAVIGGHGGPNLQGSAYIFQLNPAASNLSQIQKITAADAASNDYFGFASDISTGNIIIGAWGKNSQRGKVYFRSVD